ncbi:phosphoglycerate kinase-like isoform X2 [Triticum dicoccoides]|uniref:phosphoglycerate kinase-like isoform X2 n=1 Tax=Triticum dicoccoides TaxID=85692 RepID=UPI00188FE559|nr:phosphoglycerate kinase-like isoform X2 [Triticum dicoccoides]XP_044322854.1 phosphoglycerate kinase-like isoform X2 [Triticum aestivum]
MQVCGVQLSSATSRWRESWPPFRGSFECAGHSCCISGIQRPLCRVQCCQVPRSTRNVAHLQKEDKYSCVDRSTSYLHVQTLRNFPIEKLYGEVVLVRLDSVILLDPLGLFSCSLKKTLSTIKYLYKAGGKVLLVTSWDPVLQSVNPVLKSTESFADYMSSLLQVKVIPVNGAPCLTSCKKEERVQNDIILFENLLNFRGENANCNDFSQKLASGAAIFVNDSFSLSHKIRASTVGITRFCYASLAGFHFEEELMQLLKINDTTRRPYIAIIGGSNFLRKAPALHLLASQCDGLFFVGKLSFQIMNGLGIPVSSCLIEKNATKEVLQLIEIAHNRNIPIYYPTDLWCLNSNNNEQLEIFDSAELLSGLISLGWTPVDIGPSTLERISSLLSSYKSYPYQIPWDDVFSDTKQPLFVDIGSGNGLFLFQMARNWEGSNFLGLEMNEKLVVRCLQDVASAGKRNLYFLSTNATSTFRSIVSSYPGLLTLVSIQCPNPDFNKEQNRWRMVRRMLVEAVSDLLQVNGKIYLQSDVESVLLGMKEQFISHGKGQLVVDSDGRMENPFGVVSDWERHVLARGAPMYRTMLRKV